MPRHPFKTILIIKYVFPIGIEPISSDYKTDILPIKLRETIILIFSIRGINIYLFIKF